MLRFILFCTIHRYSLYKSGISCKVEYHKFGENIISEHVNILANAIKELYENPEKCEEIGKKARKIAEEQFDRPEFYKKIEVLMRELIEENQK